MKDNTNPSHYIDLNIQPIDFIIENNLSFCIGNAVKYISRYKNKNGIEDLKKAIWYIKKEIELEEKLCLEE